MLATTVCVALGPSISILSSRPNLCDNDLLLIGLIIPPRDREVFYKVNVIKKMGVAYWSKVEGLIHWKVSVFMRSLDWNELTRHSGHVRIEWIQLL